MEPRVLVRGDTHDENNRSCMERRSGVPCFLYVAPRVLKVIEVVWSVDWEPLAFCTWKCAC
jgi:hypothetical protein